MIVISFVIGHTPEEKVKELLLQIGDHIITQLHKVLPHTTIEGPVWVYRRESQEPSEPSITLITDTLTQYLTFNAKTVDEPDYLTWIFTIESPHHIIAIPDHNQPLFHILQPDQVSTLLRTLAHTLSTLVDVEVSYNDDHTRTGIIYHHGKPTEEEHW